MFTLAHELAHIWLGLSALSDAGPAFAPSNRVEVWCNQVAAEVLVPLDVFRAEYQKNAELAVETGRLARRFKVSTLVVLRRMRDAGGLTAAQFQQAFEEERERPAVQGSSLNRTGRLSLHWVGSALGPSRRTTSLPP